MAEICLQRDFVLSILDEISRTRALNNAESEVIEDCLSDEINAFQWSRPLEDALVTASFTTGGIARFARHHGINIHTAHQKLFRLRRSQKVVV